MFKMMEIRKDNVKGEFDRPNSLVYQAKKSHIEVENFFLRFFEKKIIFPSTPVLGINSNQSLNESL